MLVTAARAQPYIDVFFNDSVTVGANSIVPVGMLCSEATNPTACDVHPDLASGVGVGYPWIYESRHGRNCSTAPAARCRVYGIPSAQTADQAGTVFTHPPVANQRTFIELGIGDFLFRGDGVGQRGIYQASLASLVYYEGAALVPQSEWTLSPGQWAGPTLYGVGVYTETAGATISATFTGDVLTFGYLLTGSGNPQGALQVSVDGVVQPNPVGGSQPWSLSPAAGLSCQWYNPNPPNPAPPCPFEPQLYRQTGFGPGAHTLLLTDLTVAGASQSQVLFIGAGGGNGHPVYPMTLLPIGASVGAPTPSCGCHATDNDGIADFNANGIAPIAAWMLNDGIAGSLIDVNPWIASGPGPSYGYGLDDADIEADGSLIHPSIYGQMNIAAALEAAGLN